MLISDWSSDVCSSDLALALFKEAGADIEGERVRFPRGLCRKLCETIPPQFTQHARNPERNVVIGGNNTVFAPVYGPPFVRDLEGGRRYATIADFQNFRSEEHTSELQSLMRISYAV